MEHHLACPGAPGARLEQGAACAAAADRCRTRDEALLARSINHVRVPKLVGTTGGTQPGHNTRQTSHKHSCTYGKPQAQPTSAHPFWRADR
jgi:hypothetical protein